MAVTSIWSIKGWIGKVINYAENPDKTKEQTSQELISESETGQLQGLNDVITYAVNAEKTRLRQSKSMEMEVVGESEELMEQYVSGLNCAPTTAREEMIAVKIRADRPEEEIQEMKEQIKVLTEKIGTLRKEAALCDGIAARSKVIEEKFKMMREEKEKKEEQSHEHIRRSR